jgi:polar amino acid transport system substrate-binding protein
MGPLLVLLALTSAMAANDTTPVVRICTVTDYGFTMWSSGDPLRTVSVPTSAVESGSVGYDASLKDTAVNAVKGYGAVLRKAIFKDSMQLSYSLRIQPTYSAVLEGIRRGECDVGFASFQITSARQQCDGPGSAKGCIAFSNQHVPQGTTGVGFMYRKARLQTSVSTNGAIFSGRVISTLCTCMILVFVAAHIIWFFESRGGNPMFARPYSQGVPQGVWWAVVTVSTIGYGDTVPRTRPGRLFAYCWILVGIVLFATLTGEISASLITQEAAATQRPAQYSDFKGVKICSYPMYTEMHLVGYEQDTHNEENLKNCMQRLKEGQCDAVYYDLSILQVFQKSTNPHEPN